MTKALVQWRNEDELVLEGLAEHTVRDAVSTTSGICPCTLFVVPTVTYTGAFVGLYDLLYGPRAPINALFPQLMLWVDKALVGQGTLAILGEHELWKTTEPRFHSNAFVHFTDFFKIQSNLVELHVGMAQLINKHRGLLPHRPLLNFLPENEK